jgi:hypothetical protein
MTANKTYWYLIEFTCNTSISTKFRYIIAKTMEDACKRVRESLDWHENILCCKLMSETL